MVVMDTSKKDLEMFYKEWEAPLYNKILSEEVEMISREAWEFLLNAREPQTISRASVINSLNENVEEGILKFVERTGKGGYHRVYSRNMTIEEFWQYRANQVNQALEPYL